MTKALDVKLIEFFDYYPTAGGFQGMRERQEFGLGPNVDYLHSLFHVLQATGNEGLGELIQARLDSGQDLDNRPVVEQLLDYLRSGGLISGKLSEGHYGTTQTLHPGHRLGITAYRATKRPAGTSTSRFLACLITR